MRPIDADAYADHLEGALKKSVLEVNADSIQGFVIAATLTAAVVSDLRDEMVTPTIDAVEVVRCENCRYHKGGCAYVYQRITPVALDHFCGYGKPKE